MTLADNLLKFLLMPERSSWQLAFHRRTNSFWRFSSIMWRCFSISCFSFNRKDFVVFIILLILRSGLGGHCQCRRQIHLARGASKATRSQRCQWSQLKWQRTMVRRPTMAARGTESDPKAARAVIDDAWVFSSCLSSCPVPPPKKFNSPTHKIASPVF